MRYTFEYQLQTMTPGIKATSFCSVLAADQEQAREALHRQHPERVPVRIIPEGTVPEAIRQSLGYYTDDELEAYHARMQAMYDEQRLSCERVSRSVAQMTEEETAAVKEYTARRSAEQTQNEEGIHLGDILWYTWGYGMTLYSFLQVVGLKGRHTITVRELQARRQEYASMKGVLRPVRDEFRNSDTYDVRTNRMYLFAPQDLTGGTRHEMTLCPDGKLFFDDHAD